MSHQEPPWTLGPRELAGDLAKIDQQWAMVRDFLDDPSLFALRDPEVSAWSCGEEGGHIALVCARIAGGVERSLSGPPTDADREWTEWAGQVLERGGFPRGVVKVSPASDPVGRSLDEYRAALSAAEEGWSRVAARAADVASSPARFEHVALGWLTCSDWVRFCPIHTAHHLRVARKIIEARAPSELARWT